MADNFKIAVLQRRSQSHNYQSNTETIIHSMRYASQRHADILLLPECFITGYDILPAANDDVLCENNIFMEQLCFAARELHIGVVATAFTQGTEKPRNSAFVIDKDGHTLMKYDKVHTCDFSYEACLENGNEFKVCDFHHVKIGIMICYDREYPESARILMMKGAEIILVPNDCGSMRPRAQALSTRAYENMTGVVMANTPGKNAGCSCAFSPICWDENGNCVDNTIFLAGEEEGIFFADFDLDALRTYRQSEMMGNTFRKTEAYSELLNPEIREPFVRSSMKHRT